jgi:hypothetical protein
MARSAIVWILVATGLLAGAEPTASVGPAPVSEGTIVFASDSNRLTAIDLATGRRTSRRIRAIPACGAQLFVTGGRIVFAGMSRGVTTAYALPLSLDRRPTRLGSAHSIVPSATDGRVWLVGTDCDVDAMVGVREVAVDGAVTFESGLRVPGWVDGATPQGLLVYFRRAVYLWDPATGKRRALGLEWMSSAHGSLVAGSVGGSDLTILDSATGRAVPARRAGRHQLEGGGAFSPDGSLLATAARVGRRWSVALVDPRTGKATIVPGTRTGKVYPELTWSRSSGRLFIRAGRRIMAYRPGEARARALPFRLPVTAVAFAAH